MTSEMGRIDALEILVDALTAQLIRSGLLTKDSAREIERGLRTIADHSIGTTAEPYKQAAFLMSVAINGAQGAITDLPAVERDPVEQT